MLERVFDILGGVLCILFALFGARIGQSFLFAVLRGEPVTDKKPWWFMVASILWVATFSLQALLLLSQAWQ